MSEEGAVDEATLVEAVHHLEQKQKQQQQQCQ